MKNSLLLITIFFTINCCAQETTEKKNRLTDSVIEKFHVLKSNTQIKNGSYKAFFKRKTVIASGNYTNNKKTGPWDFYNPRGKLAETYDYDNNQIVFIAPLDTADDLHYLFDVKVNKGDTLYRPFKVGESYYGYIPYVSLFQIPFDTTGINMDLFDAEVELLISPLGRLADYKVRVVSAYYQYNHTFNLSVNLFNEADRVFVPSRLNEKPIVSRIIIRCDVTADGSLTF